MRTLLLAPHNDDETLFASYTLLRYRPTVVVCTWPMIHRERVSETEAAMEVLGIRIQDLHQWRFRDDDPDWDAMETKMRGLGEWEMVFAPMLEEHGHEQHNRVTEIANRVFGGTQGYATYRRECGRTMTDNEVPFERYWPAIKFRAMSCYQSQINWDQTWPWFFDTDARREWWA